MTTRTVESLTSGVLYEVRRIAVKTGFPGVGPSKVHHDALLEFFTKLMELNREVVDLNGDTERRKELNASRIASLNARLDQEPITPAITQQWENLVSFAGVVNVAVTPMLECLAAARGRYSVQSMSDLDEASGVYLPYDRTIGVREELQGRIRGVRTLLHEISHVNLVDTGLSYFSNLGFLASDPQGMLREEVAAEVAAYIAGVGLGVSGADYSALYVNLYCANNLRDEYDEGIEELLEAIARGLLAGEMITKEYYAAQKKGFPQFIPIAFPKEESTEETLETLLDKYLAGSALA